MKTLIAFLLLCSTALAGQSGITIREGTFEFGPISVSVLNRYARFELDRPTNPAIRVSGVLFASKDGGKTFLSDWTCKFSGTGTTRDIGPVIGTTCQFPHDTTHIKGSLTVAGGSITISRAVLLKGK